MFGEARRGPLEGVSIGPVVACLPAPMRQTKNRKNSSTVSTNANNGHGYCVTVFESGVR